MGNLCCTLQGETKLLTTQSPVHDSSKQSSTLSTTHLRDERSSVVSSRASNTVSDLLEMEVLPVGARRWKQGRLLAEGAFGRVFAALDWDTGRPVAIKQVLVPEQPTRKDREQIHEALAEINTLRTLDHPHIIKFLGSHHTPDCLSVFLEYAGSGSIAFLLERYGPFSELVIRRYLRQVVLAVEYLHRRGYVHRDIKGANILLIDAGVIKLADFGAAKLQIGSEKTVEEMKDARPFKSLKGTPCFMAPEILQQEGYGTSVDIWAIGCTLIEMATGTPPWIERQPDHKIKYRIRTSYESPPIPRHLSKEAKDLLAQCFVRDPEKRPTAKQLLRHAFFVSCEININKFTTLLEKHSPRSENTRHRAPVSSISGNSVSLPDSKHLDSTEKANDLSIPSVKRSSGEDGCFGDALYSQEPLEGFTVNQPPIRVPAKRLSTKFSRSMSFKEPVRLPSKNSADKG